MNLVFLSDSRLTLCNEKYYSNSLSNLLWKRYFKLGDRITVCSRVRVVEKIDLKRNNLSSHENVDFACIKLDNLWKIFFSRKMKNKIKNSILKSDCVIARMPSLIAVVGIRYAKRYKKAYFIEMIGDPWTSLWNHSNKGKCIAPIMWLITRYYIKNAKDVIYVSRNFLQQLYPTKGYSVGCPDVLLDLPNEDVLDKRIKKIEKGTENFILGLIGSMDVDYRGHIVVLQALAELKKRGITCKVKFLGPGNKERWIKKSIDLEISNQVEFCGTIPSGQPVFEWIDNIDILTMPTDAESLGRAIIEAMSRACPVIGSIETAISEQIGSDCLCKARDYIELANKIQHMIENKDYMIYCAKENFYRSFKYTNEQTDVIRESFYTHIKDSIGVGN